MISNDVKMIFSQGRGIAGILGLQNQWDVPPKCGKLRIAHFTVVFLVTWPLSDSEAG